LVNKVLLANQAQTAILAQLDLKANLGVMVLLVPLVRTDILVPLARLLDPLDQLDPRVLLAIMAHLEKMVSPAPLVYLAKTVILVLHLTQVKSTHPSNCLTFPKS
jgi:hypothetical protein